MRGPESRTLGPIGTVGRYRLAKELTHCWLANDATKDIITDYDLPAEMSGTGDVVNGRVHIHPRTPRDPAGWPELRRFLRLWSFRAIAVNQPGYYEAWEQANAGAGGGMLLEDAIKLYRPGT